VSAAERSVAIVNRAGVLIVAVDYREDAAQLLITKIERAGVEVVALDEFVFALPSLWIAAIGRAGVVVVTVDRRVNASLLRVAGVDRAGILVVAIDKRVDAPQQLVAEIERAGVVVVAIDEGVDTAPELRVTAVFRAGIEVVAIDRCKDAPQFRVASIDRAGVVVVAVDWNVGAGAVVVANVVGTGVLVVTAGRIVVAVEDAGALVADVTFERAQSVVIDALALRAGGACAFPAGITFVSRITGVGIWPSRRNTGHTPPVEVERLPKAVGIGAALGGRIDARRWETLSNATFQSRATAQVVAAWTAAAPCGTVLLRSGFTGAGFGIADPIKAERGIGELGAVGISAADTGRDTDRHAIPPTALGSVALAAQRAFAARTDNATLRTAGQLRIEHPGNASTALRIEALAVAADAVATERAAGQFLGTADLLLDEGTLAEDPGQTHRAGGTALAITALQLLITAIEPADNIAVAQGAVTADGLIAGASAGAGGTAERAVGALDLACATGGGRGGRGGRRRWRRRGNGGPGALCAGIDLIRSDGPCDGCAANAEQAFENHAAGGAPAHHPNELIEAPIVHGRDPPIQCSAVLPPHCEIVGRTDDWKTR
jgi:hypothetical protein